MSGLRKSLSLFFPLLGLVGGFAAGLPIWMSRSAVPPNSVAAWLWILGGFVAFVGGVMLIKHSRWVALVYIFGGFILLMSAGLYLPEAHQAYKEWEARSRIQAQYKALKTSPVTCNQFLPTTHFTNTRA